jgi:hypothetical protein
VLHLIPKRIRHQNGAVKIRMQMLEKQIQPRCPLRRGLREQPIHINQRHMMCARRLPDDVVEDAAGPEVHHVVVARSDEFTTCTQSLRRVTCQRLSERIVRHCVRRIQTQRLVQLINTTCSNRGIDPLPLNVIDLVAMRAVERWQVTKVARDRRENHLHVILLRHIQDFIQIRREGSLGHLVHRIFQADLLLADHARHQRAARFLVLIGQGTPHLEDRVVQQLVGALFRQRHAKHREPACRRCGRS